MLISSLGLLKYLLSFKKQTNEKTNCVVLPVVFMSMMSIWLKMNTILKKGIITVSLYT